MSKVTRLKILFPKNGTKYYSLNLAKKGNGGSGLCFASPTGQAKIRSWRA